MGQREDECYAQWRDWLARIDADLTQMALARWAFQSISAMTRTAALPPSFAFELISDWYVRAQATGVRRQTEVREDVASLATLLEQIARHPEVLTWDRYVGFSPEDDYDFMSARAREQFDRIAGDGAETIPPERPREAVQRLRQAAEPVKRYVDRIVAHQDRRDTSIPRPEDLNAALDTIFREFTEWGDWLTGAHRVVMVPVPQYDWLAPFRVAWLSRDNEHALPPHPMDRL